ncbi:hypothetical protein Plec18167_005759 [Paecilomyces lecythidis]|uniref:Uncharacterized protein n=1 Tax=Paecilomyces lecythidis TaxID=3004212 RepID=A0ABR3XHL9_9EURO
MAVEADLKREYPAVKTLVMPTDISDPESVGRLFEKVKAEFGHADILVNNAGVLAGGGAIHEEDPSEWWKNFEINVKGSFLVTQQFIKSLPSPSTPATIVNIVTSGAWLVVPFVSGYSISKLGQLQLTTYLAATYPNLTAIAIHPGMLDTDMMHPAFKRFDQNTPELLGGITVWACSKDAHFLTGKAIAANWDVDDLQARRSEIEGDKLLQMDLKGSFRKEQFE